MGVHYLPLTASCMDITSFKACASDAPTVF
jgi:hypothetical protein